MAEKMTAEQVLALPPVIDLPTAGRAWGFGRGISYELYHLGEFPCKVLQYGRFLKVRKADLLAALKMNADGTYQTGDSDAA